MTKQEFTNCFHSNPDGVGISYGLSGKTRYVKGLMKIREAWNVYTELSETLPHVAHFRIGTSGGKVPELTHPFICSKESPTPLEYEGDDPILFHNGIIGGWEDKLLNLILQTKHIPEGHMNDTRMLAMYIANTEHKILNHFSGKFIVVNNESIYQYGSGWVEENGIQFSNSGFRSYSYSVPSNYQYPTRYAYSKEVVQPTDDDSFFADEKWWLDQDRRSYNIKPTDSTKIKDLKYNRNIGFRK
jgi:hypothetical protein